MRQIKHGRTKLYCRTTGEVCGQRLRKYSVHESCFSAMETFQVSLQAKSENELNPVPSMILLRCCEVHVQFQTRNAQ